MNDSLASDPPAGAEMIRAVGGIGVAAAITNLFALAVFFTSRRLLKSSALLVGLTIGHVFNGFAHAISGFQPASLNAILVTPLYCIKIMWPNIFITTYQLLPLLLAMCGLERLLALVAPVWYRTKCTNKRLWYLTGGAFLYALLCMCANAAQAWVTSDHLIPGSCILPMVIGFEYMVYAVHFPAVLGGLCATVCTAVGICIGRRKIAKMPTTSKGEIARVQKQIRLTKCLLIISGIDVVCVVIPNIVLILYNVGMLHVELRHTIYAVLLYCSDSIWNIVAFVLFNREFRRSSIRLICCGRAMAGPAEPTTFGGGQSIRILPAKQETVIQ